MRTKLTTPDQALTFVHTELGKGARTDEAQDTSIDPNTS